LRLFDPRAVEPGAVGAEVDGGGALAVGVEADLEVASGDLGIVDQQAVVVVDADALASDEERIEDARCPG